MDSIREQIAIKIREMKGDDLLIFASFFLIAVALSCIGVAFAVRLLTG